MSTLGNCYKDRGNRVKDRVYNSIFYHKMPLYQFSWVVLKSSKKDKAHFLLFLLFRLHGFEGVDGERGGDNI